ncbi:DinB family protein [Dyadobacter sp. Leaf189]|uniref:DinB family protein n=1 Tax=Dyadobacter sp. Leaf189 TaxID=1736295 RepID=UPI0006F5EF2E|nr:DinB family protein [Dyadobacter sp. Leaf189]KQS27759.1 damage-inducible protein DinB [Dyadobacter sp. Leaf189]
MDNTELAAAYVKELEAEYSSTKKCLERIPFELSDYKPHPKSMQMGYLTLLVAEIPKWIKLMVEDGEVNFVTYERVNVTTSEHLLSYFEDNIAGAKSALQRATNESLSGTFYLKNGEEVLYSQPILEGVSSTLNHWVHHRGQLTVYMRLNDIMVPSIYGPSADDRSYSVG